MKKKNSAPVALPSNPADRTKIKNMIRTISDSMTRMDAERDAIKEVKKEMKELFELPPKQINKMAKAYHKNSFKEEVQTAEEFDALYTSVFGDVADDES